MPGRVLAALKREQARYGCLSPETLRELSAALSRPLGELYGAASFYNSLSLAPPARTVVRLCRSLPCQMKEAGELRRAVETKLGIRPGETTPDGRYRLELVNCLGACDRAPAVMINGQVHGAVTPAELKRLLP